MASALNFSDLMAAIPSDEPFGRAVREALLRLQRRDEEVSGGAAADQDLAGPFPISGAVNNDDLVVVRNGSLYKLYSGTGTDEWQGDGLIGVAANVSGGKGYVLTEGSKAQVRLNSQVSAVAAGTNIFASSQPGVGRTGWPTTDTHVYMVGYVTKQKPPSHVEIVVHTQAQRAVIVD